MALLMSGSLGFVITACKAACLWVELLLRGKARPHRYSALLRGVEGEEMKGKGGSGREKTRTAMRLG